MYVIAGFAECRIRRHRHRDSLADLGAIQVRLQPCVTFSHQYDGLHARRTTVSTHAPTLPVGQGPACVGRGRRQQDVPCPLRQPAGQVLMDNARICGQTAMV